MSNVKKFMMSAAGGFQDSFWLYQFGNNNDQRADPPYQASNAVQLDSGSTILMCQLRGISGNGEFSQGIEIWLPVVDVDGNIISGNTAVYYYDPAYSIFTGGIELNGDEVWMYGYEQASGSNNKFIARLDFSTETSPTMDSVKHIKGSNSDWFGTYLGEFNSHVHIGTDYYLFGRAYNSSSGYYNGGIAKFNSSDTNQWAYWWDGGFIDRGDGQKIAGCTDGTDLFVFQRALNNTYATITSCDTSGSTNWSYYFRPSSSFNELFGVQYNPVTDEIIIAYEDTVNLGGGNGKVIVLLSIDPSNASKNWERTIGNPNGNDWRGNIGEGMEIDSAGNIIVTCNCSSGAVSNSKPSGANGAGVPLVVKCSGTDGSVIRVQAMMAPDTNPIAQLEPMGSKLTQNDNIILSMAPDVSNNPYGKRWLFAQFPLDGSITDWNGQMATFGNETMYLFDLVSSDFTSQTNAIGIGLTDNTSSTTRNSVTMTVTDTTSSHTFTSYNLTTDNIVAIT